MKIGGWRTRSVFERYAIVSRNDIADAMRKLQNTEAELQSSTQIGHDSNAVENTAQTIRVNFYIMRGINRLDGAGGGSNPHDRKGRRILSRINTRYIC